MGSTTPKSELPLPYWQINVSPFQRQDQCPLALQNLSEKDISILSTPDASYQTLSWPGVRQIIADNRIDRFQRQPSELRRYLLFAHKTKKTWGSIINFILNERVQWKEPVIAKGTRPFEEAEDVKILWNDWPYGIDSRIVHLVIWTKFELPDDPETGDLTAEARREINEYVDEVFGKVCGDENVSPPDIEGIGEMWWC
jgi:hypothetical protein